MTIEKATTTATALHVPLEILTLISEHLDLESARCLARSCRALREAGEMKVWESVDLTGGPFKQQKDSYIDVEAHRARNALAESKVSHALAALAAHPPRQAYVRKVVIEPSDGETNYERSDALGRVLRWVAPQLKRLDILPLTIDPASSGFVRTQLNYNHLMGHLSNLSFPRLTFVRFAYSTEAAPASLRDFLDIRMPLLAELEIASAENTYPRRDFIRDDPRRSPFLHLRRISFDNFSHGEEDQSLEILAVLLKLAPNLEGLRLRGEWQPFRGDIALQRLYRAEKLRSLTLLEPEGEQGVHGMDFRSFGIMRTGLAIEEAVVEMRRWTEQHDMRFEILQLPRAPKLKRLSLITSRRLPLEEYVAMGVGSVAYPTYRIHPRLFRHLWRTPQLETMFLLHLNNGCPSIYNSHFVEPEYYVPPSRWEEEGHRGGIIRQYTSGLQSLWHIRALSRAVYHPEHEAYIGARRNWHDFTHFDGRTVPRATLEAVYEAAGEDLVFLEGGRGLQMGDEAWSILREWRKGAAEEVELHDDVSEAEEEGFEDNDDESEAEEEEKEYDSFDELETDEQRLAWCIDNDDLERAQEYIHDEDFMPYEPSFEVWSMLVMVCTYALLRQCLRFRRIATAQRWLVGMPASRFATHGPAQPEDLGFVPSGMPAIENPEIRKSGARRLDTLPGEVIQAIALVLDVKTASSFSRVCKALREAGESRVWHTLDITSGYNEADLLALDDLTEDESSRRVSTVTSNLRRAPAAFVAYPFRMTCVRTLRIEPSDGEGDNELGRSLIHLLRRVSSHITRLEILPIPSAEVFRETEGWVSLITHVAFCNALRDAKLSFPSLRHLKFTCDDGVPNPIDSWILGMPNLQELELASHDGHFCTEPTYTLPPNSLPHLRRLTLDHISPETGDHSLAVLAMLLRAAPDVEFLRLRGKWSPKAEDPALVAMAECKKLKTVVLAELGDHAFDGYDVEPRVKYYRLGAADLAMEELAVEEPDWEEAYEPGFTRQRIPRAPHLRRITFLTGPRPPLAEYVAMGVGPTPPLTLPMSRYDLAGIRQNPHLTTILLHHIPKPFPSVYDADYVDPVLFVDPSRWEAEGYRGSVLRQYINPQDPEDEFWHIRTLTRAVRDGEDEVDEYGHIFPRAPRLLEQRVWQDFTLYKDALVPRDVLKAVYAAVGEKWDFIKGGRSLPLGQGDSAWSILRKWREGVYVEYEGNWDDGLDEDSEAESEANSEDDAAFENWMANGPDPGDGAWLGYGPMGHFPDDGSSP